MTVTREVRIVNAYGLHARPATKFVELASKFSADVVVTRDGTEVSGKSVMGLLMLAAEKGTVLVIRSDGDDAEACVEALARLVGSGFEET